MRKGSDPAGFYAHDLVSLAHSAQALLSDDGYAAVLPHLEALRLVLPDAVPLPCPRRLRSVEEEVPGWW